MCKFPITDQPNGRPLVGMYRQTGPWYYISRGVEWGGLRIYSELGRGPGFLDQFEYIKTLEGYYV